ncbi:MULTISPECIES: hypothetical protein [unclassified Nocardia]|uniref:hypothetical protein n=1 Tax=unclassified Nocardia TaxID=2637762 RepID=UPI001CE3F16F|nr:MULTISPECIES: hypothetical protein [unclassified Nocardia]
MLASVRRYAPVAIGFAALAGSVALLPGAPASALPYGPYTCAQGFVWREAYDGDQVCVTPGDRDIAHSENVQGPSHRSPNGGAYGPDTCLPGFVWRETRPSDHVCADPSRRDRAAAQNAEGVTHLADPTQLPAGGVHVRTELTLTGGTIFLDGATGLTEGGKVIFYAAGVNTGNPRQLGERQADGHGALGPQQLADVRCDLPRNKTATVVVMDVRSGVAKSAGTTYAFSC